MGDIIITTTSGVSYNVEVKDDSVIAKTKNILCEDEVYYKKTGTYKIGNMYNNNTDIYCVVS